MKLATPLVMAALLPLADLPMLCLGAPAGMLDERMLAGTWILIDDGSRFTITINSDGAGNQDSEDNPAEGFTFTWVLDGDVYRLAQVGSQDWHESDYGFSSLHSRSTLVERADGSVYELDRDSSIFSGVCCSSCCCGGVIVPFVATAGIAEAIASRRYR